LGCGLGWTQGIIYLIGSKLSHTNWHFFRKKGMPCPTTFCCDLCKNSRTDRDGVWVVDSCWLSEALLRGVPTGATWRIPLNCAAAMRPFCQVTLTSCYVCCTGTSCETDVNECASTPCQQGGTCEDQVNGFTCSCPPGFTGRFSISV